jgi:hypothetical protein
MQKKQNYLIAQELILLKEQTKGLPSRLPQKALLQLQQLFSILLAFLNC